MIKELSSYFTNIRDALCEPYGLSSIQAVIILDVYHHPEERRVTDICKRLHKSTNTISPLINRLIQKGYLMKKVSKDDARSMQVYLTDKTKEMVDNILVDISDYTWPFLNLYQITNLITSILHLSFYLRLQANEISNCIGYSWGK